VSSVGLDTEESPFHPNKTRYFPIPPIKGVLAQLVERLNGIEEVRGSNPLGSKFLGLRGLRQWKAAVSTYGLNRFEHISGCLRVSAYPPDDFGFVKLLRPGLKLQPDTTVVARRDRGSTPLASK
jgi:hypothetical protein